MINNQILKSILAEWSFWDNTPKGGLTRKIDLPQSLQADLALVIQGVRRCGKSTLLTQLPKHYGLPISQCYFCNFEDPRLLDDLDHPLLSQIVTLARSEVASNKPCYFFLDEIQNVNNWEKWLHTQLERPQRKNYFILTGSNSCLLSGEFATSLTGRHITIELYPFSFIEFKKLTKKKSLEDYLHLGGFPRPLMFEHPFRLLQEYFNDIILRDVVQRVKARSAEAIKQVVKMAYETCGSELSYRKIAAVTGLSVDTVKMYLEACEQAYLLFACPYFSFSEKKRQARQKKYYPIDPGLRHAITNTSHRDFGKSLEILMYLYLKQQHEQIYYWQEIHKGEVDFVTIDGQSITPYQITWDKPEPRHEKALQYFYEAFPQANEAIFITKENAKDYL
ncbi:MAG: ATP-binding protein [Coxiellaceae bacterium]|nr:ATP-binding protein [Coxiellaceae bacterium]